MSYCDFISGWGGGMLGFITGHPLDTVKVNQQNLGIGLFPCIKKIHETHGFKGYFRGMTFPLLLQGGLNSIFFGTYGCAMEVFNSIFKNSSQYMKMKSLHLDSFICGSIGGGCHIFIACPVEIVKIKLQATGLNYNQFTSPFSVIEHILKSQGPRGLFQGFKIMLVRDVPAFGIYMSSYAFLTQNLDKCDIFLTQSSKPNSAKTLIAGGLAGTISWWAIIPIDVIKSRLQSDDLLNPKYNGIIDCTQKVVLKNGFRGLFRGALLISLRAFPVNAATFLGYEWLYYCCQNATN